MAFASESEACDLSVVGHVVTSRGLLLRGEVRIRDGKVAEVRPEAGDASGGRRIDVGDAFVLPGLIDPHVHSLSDASEGIATATRSAAAGGVTTILEMPFDDGAPVWTVERLEAKKALVADEAHVDVGLFATVRPGGGVREVAALAEAGAVTFKVSTYHTHPDRFPRTPDDELREVFAAIAATGRRVCVHAENDEIVKRLVAELQAAGRTDPRAHCESRPPVTETAAIANVLELAREAAAQVPFCHMSLPHSIELIREYARDGHPVSGEICPHYLLLSEDDMDAMGARAKINPPVRSAPDVAGLWDLLRRGEIDVLSSDHAPWPLTKKDKPDIFDNASGAPGVETLFNVTAGAALAHGVPLADLVGVATWKTARLFGIAHRKGDLAPGLDGDIAVFDPSVEWTLDQADLHSNAGWSPYHQRRLKGRVTMAISRGKVVYDGTEVVARPGRGDLVLHERATR